MPGIFNLATVLSQTPPLTKSAYSAGQCMGGLLTFPKAYRGGSSGGLQGKQVVLNDLVVTDLGNQKAALTILFYQAKPTATFTDQAQPKIATDVLQLVGQVLVAGTDYTTSGSDSVAVAEKTALNIIIPTTETTGNLYAVIITTGTPTPVTIADLTLTLKLLQD